MRGGNGPRTERIQKRQVIFEEEEFGVFTAYPAGDHRIQASQTKHKKYDA